AGASLTECDQATGE
ncbi:hypothetical protein V6N13_125952, partial [Hibiscus sabdariffa]